jgi:multisubunit Na+/H+ antiporter MnhC subunit
VTARAVRRVVIAVCVTGIAGMIVTSIADSTSGALAFGLVTAAAVLCLMVATAVTGGGRVPLDAEAEARAQRVEDLVAALVRSGASEDDLRRLVGEAVKLGRSTRPV